jgi:hypothetical protein
MVEYVENTMLNVALTCGDGLSSPDFLWEHFGMRDENTCLARKYNAQRVFDLHKRSFSVEKLVQYMIGLEGDRLPNIPSIEVSCRTILVAFRLGRMKLVSWEAWQELLTQIYIKVELSYSRWYKNYPD